MSLILFTLIFYLSLHYLLYALSHFSSFPHLRLLHPLLFFCPIPALSQKLKSTGEKQVGHLLSNGPDDRVRAPRFSAGLCSGLAHPLSRLKMTQGPAVTSAARVA